MEPAIAVQVPREAGEVVEDADADGAVAEPRGDVARARRERRLQMFRASHGSSLRYSRALHGWGSDLPLLMDSLGFFVDTSRAKYTFAAEINSPATVLFQPQFMGLTFPQAQPPANGMWLMADASRHVANTSDKKKVFKSKGINVLFVDGHEIRPTSAEYIEGATLATHRLRGRMPLDAHALRWYYGLVVDPYPLTIRRADGRVQVEEIAGDAWSRPIDLSGQFQQPRAIDTVAPILIIGLLLVPVLLRISTLRIRRDNRDHEEMQPRRHEGTKNGKYKKSLLRAFVPSWRAFR